MLPATAFTRLVGCRLPLQQAGMGAVSTPALAAAVAREGGLGMLAAAGVAAPTLVDAIREARDAAPDGVVGVNFLMPFLDLDAFDAAAQESRLVECFYGEPDPRLVARAHDANALVSWQVGSRDEAVAAVDAGCDLVVVQGLEAGGHVRGTAALHALLAETRPVVDVPIVAAGGVGSGRAVAKALAGGADAVRVGTRFVATVEADVHPSYADALVRAGAGDTILTQAFSMGWPDAPHRVLASCVAASDDAPEARSPVPPTRTFAGDTASAALYAGTSVGTVRDVVPAAEVVRELVRDAAPLLDRAP